MAKLLRTLRNDDGIGIVEVIVALMIFAVIALGMGFSLISMTRLTGESTTRETATNLAAAEIDRVQSLADPSTVVSGTQPPVTIDGVTYTVKRSVGWVPASGNAGRCGTGGGNLLYKRVNVTVTWPGMYLSRPVRADTALAPSTRINDPDAGTIIVAITGAADGIGTPGVTVTITPDSGGGGSPIAAAIPATDSDGCTFALKVDPGKYSITISKTGHVSADNQTAGTQKLAQTVTAGSTLPLNFQYDLAATLTPKYAANSTRNPSIASNMPIHFVGGSANKAEPTPVGSEKLFPKTNGYLGITGAFLTCAAVNPDNWTANATKQDAVSSPTVAAAPGASANLPVAMGVVNVTIPNVNSFITAVQSASAATDGDPGCAGPDTAGYRFSNTGTTAFTKNTVVPIALPYGKWTIYTGTSVGAQTTLVPTANLSVVEGVVAIDTATNGLVTGLVAGGTVAGSVVTLDPRAAK